MNAINFVRFASCWTSMERQQQSFELSIWTVRQRDPHRQRCAWYLRERVANTNFFPNGGRHPQPGYWLGIRSHRRAYEFFATSVRNNNFIGCACARLNQAEATRCSGNTLNISNSLLTKRGYDYSTTHFLSNLIKFMVW